MQSESGSQPSALPVALLGLTIVAGVVDAVSYLALGHVFTANMTGNVIFLAFAVVGVPGVSVARSLVALATFMLGALIGGRAVAVPAGERQLSAARGIFAVEVALLLGAAAVAIGLDAASAEPAQVYAIIALTALAMGMRTAAVRKLGVLDLTTTVLTLTIAGVAADSSLAHGSNPRWGRRLASIIALFAGVGIGAVLVRHSVSAALLGGAVVAGASALFAKRRSSEGLIDHDAI